ncbi:RNA transcription, translation and transport factor protein [Haematobia irritans]|uniref:RNA transcription, translation and transport factor protein n=1 Tax=Haematobia irritans TaxID=7368 RepID=UPI003F4F4499
MLKLKLEALEHPTPDKLDYNNRNVFASTILWLEDQKIRTYKIEDRENLRRVDDLNQWEQAYTQYKQDLGMPSLKTPLEELTWILSYAIRLEFLDAPDAYKDLNSEKVAEQSNKSVKPSIKNENFFDNMDFQHKDFIAGVRSLAAKLKIPNHPNHLLQLEAIARIVKERMAPGVRDRPAVVGTPFPFEMGNDIVSPDDPNLDYPVRILRLLQIQSLRELQTHINETIVAVQNVTANPKTDTKLGKVGF